MTNEEWAECALCQGRGRFQWGQGAKEFDACKQCNGVGQVIVPPSQAAAAPVTESAVPMTNKELDALDVELRDFWDWHEQRFAKATTKAADAITALRAENERLRSENDALIENIATNGERTRLMAENERLARDARRYEWLRNVDNEDGGAELKLSPGVWEFVAGDELDERIDAAMSKQEKMDDK